MPLLDRLRTGFDRASGAFEWYAAVDHPVDGGITGEEYPEQPEE